MYVVKRGFKPYVVAKYIKDAGFTVDESFLLNIHRIFSSKGQIQKACGVRG